jgi:hypothetical protein
VPYAYDIHTDRHRVHTRRWGIVTEAELLEMYDQLRQDPRFDPEYDQLADLIGVETVDIGGGTLRRLARMQVFGGRSRRAFVADRDVNYGLLRMFQAHSELNGQQIRVFRDLDRAEHWLGE